MQSLIQVYVLCGYYQVERKPKGVIFSFRMVRKLLILRKGRKTLESVLKTLRLVKLLLDKEVALSGNVYIFVRGGFCGPEEVVQSCEFSKDADRKVIA